LTLCSVLEVEDKPAMLALRAGARSAALDWTGAIDCRLAMIEVLGAGFGVITLDGRGLATVGSFGLAGGFMVDVDCEDVALLGEKTMEGRA
jgi:hypothetical protein